MTVWVLFVWMSTGPIAVMSYNNKAECDQDGDKYKRHACVKVVVPK